MKNLCTIFLLLKITIASFAQIPYNAIALVDKEFNNFFFDQNKNPTVKGKILNIPEKGREKASISYSLVTPFEQSQNKKSCKLNADGTFELKLDHAFPYQQIWISIGRLFYTGIYVDKDLYIELDADKLITQKGVKYNGEGVKYLGTDGTLNNYMNNHLLYKRNEQQSIAKEISNLKRDRNIEYDQYLAQFDSLYSILHNLDKEYILANPTGFSWIILNERKSDYYASLCVKHWGRKMNETLFQEIKNHKPYITSNTGMQFYSYFYVYLNSIARRKKAADLSLYKTYTKLADEEVSTLNSFLDIEQMRLNKQDFDAIVRDSLLRKSYSILNDTLEIEDNRRTIALLDSLFEQPKSDFLKLKMTSKNPQVKIMIGELVLENIKTEWCKTVVMQEYKKSKEKLNEIQNILKEIKLLKSDVSFGKPIAEMPSGAKLYQSEEVTPDQLLANLINTFTGKALYIDIWATWCRPCIEEMPHSNKLHDETKDLPIEFVYLCTSSGSNIDMWKQKIAEHKIGGTHIFMEKESMNKLMKLFSLNSYPSYLLIDSKGNYKPDVLRPSLYNKEKFEKMITQHP